MAAKPPRRDTGRRVGLTPRVIGEAALELIDSEGSRGLTMRALASRLDVTPMALYNHVEGRAEVQRLVVDALFAEVAELRESRGTAEHLSRIAHRLRTVYLAHPHAMPLIQTVAPTQIASLGLIETVLRKLTSAGYDIERSRQIWVGLVSLVNGHVAYELQGHFADPDAAEGLPEELPLLRHALEIGPIDRNASFDDAVSDYLRGAEEKTGTGHQERHAPWERA